ncbi:MAG: STAS domain-containing protein [Solirubrobacteraceae bacterium]
MTPPELTIHSYEQDDQVVVLVLRGELDIASAPMFAHAIVEMLEQSPPGVLLDIGAVEFVDSTGLRAILAARALCAERSRAFALTQPAPPVQRLFEMTGVLDELPRGETDGGLANTFQLWPQRPSDTQSPSPNEDDRAIGSELPSDDRRNGHHR